MNHRRTSVPNRTPAQAALARDLKPLRDLTEYAREYTRARPEMVAACAFAFGFILGWRLKPW